MIVKAFLLAAAAIFAFWISAICGGGASLVLIPILNLLLPSTVVPIALTIGTFTSSASRIAVFRKHIHWKLFFWFVPFSIPAVLLGAALIKYANPIYLQLGVAIFLIANVPQLFKSKEAKVAEVRPYANWLIAVVGFFAGFVSGITGAIGLLFNRFYLSHGLTKEEIVATRAANEIGLHFIKIVIYVLLGLYSGASIWLGVTIAFGAVLSSLSLKYILPYLSENIFRKIGYAAMVFSGLALLITTSNDLVKTNEIKIAGNEIIGENETTIKWRQSEFSLEFAFDDGLEVEQAILPSDLPTELLKKYNLLEPRFDKILLEKVIKLNDAPGYEFYCYKAGRIFKLEYQIEEKD